MEGHLQFSGVTSKVTGRFELEDERSDVVDPWSLWDNLRVVDGELIRFGTSRQYRCLVKWHIGHHSYVTGANCVVVVKFNAQSGGNIASKDC